MAENTENSGRLQRDSAGAWHINSDRPHTSTGDNTAVGANL